MTPSAIRRYVVPGRVELVGKHVDYAGGRSLTCAVDLALIDGETLSELGAARRCRSGARECRHAARRRRRAPTGAAWSVYVAAVARRFARDFPHFRRGVSVRMSGDLPVGAASAARARSSSRSATALVRCESMRRTMTQWSRAISNSLARAEYFAAMETGAPYGPFAGEAGVGVRGGAQDHVAIICGAGRYDRSILILAGSTRAQSSVAGGLCAGDRRERRACDQNRQRAAPIQSGRRGDARARSTMECRNRTSRRNSCRGALQRTRCSRSVESRRARAG